MIEKAPNRPLGRQKAKQWWFDEVLVAILAQDLGVASVSYSHLKGTEVVMGREVQVENRGSRTKQQVLRTNEVLSYEKQAVAAQKVSMCKQWNRIHWHVRLAIVPLCW